MIENFGINNCNTKFANDSNLATYCNNGYQNGGEGENYCYEFWKAEWVDCSCTPSPNTSACLEGVKMFKS